MHKKLNYLLKITFSILILSMISCQKDEVTDVTDSKNLENVIKSEFVRLNMPGISYVAVSKDSIVYMGAMGYANIEEKKPFTPQTRMMLASVSKTLLPTAIMQLSEKGLISIENDVNDYLPFDVKNPNFPDAKITVEMLLTHTSSISDKGYNSPAFYLSGYLNYPQPLGEFVEDYLTPVGQYYSENSYSENSPGSVYSYSNSGASLLGYIIECVSGLDYNEYCKLNIFQPLGMTYSSFLYSETPIDEIASFYNDMNLKPDFYTYPDYPAGHLITTVEDLSKFMRAYIMGGTFNGYQLLKPESVDFILQEHFTDNFHNQGLIFYKFDFYGLTLWGHNGGDLGLATEMYFDLDNKTGCIVFINKTMSYSLSIKLSLLKFANQF